MESTKSCFIRKNTPKLREKLKELGYEEYPYGNITYTYLYADIYEDGY